MRTALIVSAHAKINLTLEVLGKRPDGYHNLRSIVRPIGLHDTLEITPSSSLDWNELPGVVYAHNLAGRAACALRQAARLTNGAHIHLTKRIPVGAGLGGGSADAAATLKALNIFWDLHWPLERLHEIALEIGSDVPALLREEAVLMEGRGESITPLAISPLKDFPLRPLAQLVLKTPPIFVSTRDVFVAYRSSDHGQGANDLQPAAVRLYPEIGKLIASMCAEGLADVMMSGSGGSVFGWRTQNI